ncbi:MAG: ral stress protein [Bacteroidota bacterium]|jgi:tellurium resistance protein TerD
MAIQLQKVESGQRINLSKSQPGLKRVKIGLSWDVKDGVTADLDASALVLNEQEKMLTEESIVFYNQLELYQGAIKHSGDERAGDKEGDDETITIDLSKLPADVKIILAVITIYGESQGALVNFGRVKNASVRLYDADKNQALYEYDLSEDASRGTAVEMARLYFKDGAWRFTALGDIVGTSANGLVDIINKYQR